MMIPLIKGMRAYTQNSIQQAFDYFSYATAIEEQFIPDTSSPTLILGRAAEFLGLHLGLIFTSIAKKSVITMY